MFPTSTAPSKLDDISTRSEPTVSEATKAEPQQLTKRKRSSAPSDGEPPVDSHSPKKKSKVRGTARSNAKCTKIISKNVATKEKQAEIVSVKSYRKSKHFFVKEKTGTIKKFIGCNIRTSSKLSRTHERNTLQVRCT